ncbi:SRP40, C-terminal domain-containing protein [Auriculariales sp. MPI-PUGE-AT-0066]|nr:SRP40, C-terminal domain-containing protein [Auriculariales sp. MPI-PUGE-AT-0066]
MSGTSDDNTAATYSLVYAFLKSRGNTKAAQEVKQAAPSAVVVLKDAAAKRAGKELEDAVQAWRAGKTSKPIEAQPIENTSKLDVSSSSSSSSSESSSESSSSSSSDSDSESDVKPVKPAAPAVSKRKSESPPARAGIGARKVTVAVKSSPTDSHKTLSSGDDKKTKSASQKPATSSRSTSGTSASKTQPKPHPTPSSSDTDSSTGSSSEDDTPKPTPVAKSATTKTALKKAEASSSSSSSSSSDSDDEHPAKPVPTKAAATLPPKRKVAPTSSSNSSSDSSSSSSDSEDVPPAKPIPTKAAAASQPKNKLTNLSSSSSSSSESSDSSSDDEAPAKSKTASTAALNPPAETAEEVRAVKKRKLGTGEAVVTSVESTEREAPVPAGGEKADRRTNERFSRIKADQVAYYDPRLKDNTFESKPRPTNDYGQKAHEDLIVTRGAGFRKEKNKKKRGSYRGGEITMQSHSIKFS